MSLHKLVRGIVLLSMPWLIAEIGSHFWHSSNAKHQAKARRLPLTRSSNDHADDHDDIGRKRFTITRGTLWVKVETSALNKIPAGLLTKLEALSNRQRNARQQNFLHILYDCGSVFAVLAHIVSILLIVWCTFMLLGQIVDLSSATSDEQRRPSLESLDVSSDILRRRQQDDDQKSFTSFTQYGSTTKSDQTSSWSINLVPLIPGLTLPWSHLVPLVLALFVTQVVHEAGHALCGALHGFEPIQTGFLLFYPAVPGAFVVLPRQASLADTPKEHNLTHDEEDEGQEDESDSEEERMMPSTTLREKARIISAGVWHNALTFCILGALLVLPLGRIAHGLFWKDSSGIRAYSIDEFSPLAQHIASGSLVTGLDDLRLNASVDANQRLSRWNAFLSYLPDPKTHDSFDAREQGWCVSNVEWQRGSTSCCDVLTKPADGQTIAASKEQIGVELCFLSQGNMQQRCYNPVSILNKKRCRSRCAEEDSLCIKPDKREELVRITIQEAKEGQNYPAERVVLFQGGREAIQRTLKVSPFDFRFGFILWPEALFHAIALVIRYTFTLSMAMAVFNMLPLPTLDGDVLLQIAFAYLAQRYASRARHRTFKDDEIPNSVDLHGMQADRRIALSALNKSSTDNARGDASNTGHTLAQSTVRHVKPLPRMKKTNAARPIHHAAAAAAARTTRPAEDEFARRSVSRQAKMLAQLHTRIRWTTMVLTFFVMGGSVVVHVVQTG